MDGVVRIDGRSDFQDAVRVALAEASVAGWRDIWLCDPDFASWPLGETGVVDSLTRWVGAHRRLTLFALHYDEVLRCHPRWVHWRRQWAHAVHCRAVQELSVDDVPAMLHTPAGLTLRLFDAQRHRGTVSRLAADGVQARELIDAISQRSVEALPPTTLGL